MHFGRVSRDLLAAPFNLENPIPRLGSAIWLYLWLLVTANRTGHVCRRAATLAQKLGVSEEQMQRWLGRLQDSKLVQIQNPAPYLVLKLRLWSSNDPDRVEKYEETKGVSSEQGDLRREVPVGKQASLPKNKHTQTASEREERGVGEGDALLQDVLTALGPADEKDVQDLLGRYPETLIRQALQRVAVTPPSKIRKSKFALFLYLLVKLSQASHDRDPQD